MVVTNTIATTSTVTSKGQLILFTMDRVQIWVCALVVQNQSSSNQLLTSRRNVTSWSFFDQNVYKKCSDQRISWVPPIEEELRDRFTVSSGILYSNRFFSRISFSVKLLQECFPLRYKYGLFKTKVDKCLYFVFVRISVLLFLCNTLLLYTYPSFVILELFANNRKLTLLPVTLSM